MRDLIGRAFRSTAIRLAITVAILWYLSTRIDMAGAARAIAEIKLPYLALVLALVAMDRSVMILRWVLLLRGSGIDVSASAAARVFLVSSFVGSFLPAGVGADAARAYGLSRQNTASSEARASVAVDRLLGILSLVVMGAVGLASWSPAEGPSTSLRAGDDWRLIIAVILLALVSIGVFWGDRILRAIVPDHLHAGPLAARVLRVVDAVSRYRDRRGVLMHVMVWSLVVQLLRITQAYFLGVGLGLSVPFSYYLLFMPLGLLLLLLPISISGFGLPQGAIVWMLQPIGVPAEQAFALTTMIVLTGLAGNLPGLWLYLRKGEG